MLVKVHVHVQEEAEQAEAGAHGKWAWWESRVGKCVWVTAGRGMGGRVA